MLPSFPVVYLFVLLSLSANSPPHQANPRHALWLINGVIISEIYGMRLTSETHSHTNHRHRLGGVSRAGREEKEKKIANKGLVGSGLLSGNGRNSPACVWVCVKGRAHERERE